MLIEGMGQRVLDIRVVSPDKAVSVLEGPLGDKRVIVLFQGVDEAVTARKAGMVFERLNLGNIHPREGCRDLTPSAHLSPGDERELLAMLAQGVLVEARAVPSDESPDVAAILATPCGCGQGNGMDGAGRG
jgi:mannose/fructose/N-acetylgalactosamine-specific phosphotransferase system component IIB